MYKAVAQSLAHGRYPALGHAVIIYPAPEAFWALAPFHHWNSLFRADFPILLPPSDAAIPRVPNQVPRALIRFRVLGEEALSPPAFNLPASSSHPLLSPQLYLLWESSPTGPALPTRPAVPPMSSHSCHHPSTTTHTTLYGIRLSASCYSPFYAQHLAE